MYPSEDPSEDQPERVTSAQLAAWFKIVADNAPPGIDWAICSYQKPIMQITPPVSQMVVQVGHSSNVTPARACEIIRIGMRAFEGDAKTQDGEGN